MSIENQFTEIKNKLIKHYTKANILHITAHILSYSKSLLIYLTFYNSTDLNYTTKDIEFSISLSNSFPDDQPYVNCLSNFTIPTIFDNRNLLKGILNHNWVYKSGYDAYICIEEIILQIPSFIKKINEERNNKLLGFYGYYNLNHIYDINHFILNPEMVFTYKINLHLKPKTLKAFIIVTDIYLLLFNPIRDNQTNLCKLLFCGELRKISKSISSKHKDKKTLILIWDKTQFTLGYQIEFSFVSAQSTFNDFLSQINQRVDMLNKSFVVFEDNEQEKEEVSLIKKLKNSEAKIENYKALIEKKEDLYQKNKSLYLIKELATLYEKMVDLLSADENSEFTVYLDKMKNILNEEGIDNQLTEDLSNKKLFEECKSYVNYKPKYEVKYLRTIYESEDLFNFYYEENEDNENNNEENYDGEDDEEEK